MANKFQRETTAICAHARTVVRLSVRTKFVVVPIMAKHWLMDSKFQRETATCAHARLMVKCSVVTNLADAHIMAKL